MMTNWRTRISAGKARLPDAEEYQHRAANDPHPQDHDQPRHHHPTCPAPVP
jgi:hypothetical protein